MATSASRRNMLEHMWVTGEWSDLTIIAGGKHFKVHKTVVCHGCPFLKAACTRDWQEARTSVISLPEDAYTIEELLRHLYGMGLLHMEQEPSAMDAHIFLGLWIVADKYHIDTFFADTEFSFLDAIDGTNCTLRSEGPMLLVELGSQIFDLDRPTVAPKEVLTSVLLATAGIMDSILKDKAAWDKMVANTGYYHDLMRFMGAWSQETWNAKLKKKIEWKSK